MSKYIDADRLKAEIEKPKNELKVGNYYLDNSEQAVGYENALIDFELLIDSLQQEQPESGSSEKPNDHQPEVDLEKFTEKIKTFQARYKHPESISIKGAMAFMARMFYQYPNVARLWYEQLPKATMDNSRKEE